MIAQEDGLGFYAQTVRQLAALADQFQADIGDLSGFLFNKNPNVSNSGHDVTPGYDLR
jgi:hypothetical protein